MTAPQCSKHGPPGVEKGIVLAQFGTSDPHAGRALLNIGAKVHQGFPDAFIKMAFTSEVIRRIWRRRREDETFWTRYPFIPAEFAAIQDPPGAVADLLVAGCRSIVVQPVMVASGKEYQNLIAAVLQTNTIDTGIRTRWDAANVSIASPLLPAARENGDVVNDIRTLAEALRTDVFYANSQRAALVYMGHGSNSHSGESYLRFEQTMHELYPETHVRVGCLKGFPSISDVVRALANTCVSRVVLKPLLIVAGRHARKDMAGGDPTSFKRRLERNGLTVIPILQGLGEIDQVANIFLQRIGKAFQSQGSSLSEHEKNFIVPLGKQPA